MPDFGFTAPVDATVPAKVIDAGWTTSGKGTPGVECVFALPQGTPAGLTITHTIWVSAKSANMAHKQLKSLGVDTDTVDESLFNNDAGIQKLLLGARCELVLTLEEANEYHDTDKWKVKYLNDAGGALASTDNPLSILRAREKNPKKKAKADAAASQPSASPNDQAVAAGAEEDDIPF